MVRDHNIGPLSIWQRTVYTPVQQSDAKMANKTLKVGWYTLCLCTLSRWWFGFVVLTSLGTSTKFEVTRSTSSRVSTEMGDRLRVMGYTVLVFNRATQANSAWSSLLG